MASYIIYHPERNRSVLDSLTVYHDNFKGNQDPYMWNKKFLHTFCHMTQIKNEIGDINFWVWGKGYPNFTELVCDCVFVVDEIHQWKNVNHIESEDPLVENLQSFNHHYKWVNDPDRQHFFKRRKHRFTLKAQEHKSFQPQNNKRQLIDILPFMNENGISTDELINSIAKTKSGKKAINSKPYKIEDNLSQKLYDYLFKNAVIKLKGKDLHMAHSLQKINYDFINVNKTTY